MDDPAHDDAGGAQQLRGGGAGETHGPGAADVHGAAGFQGTVRSRRVNTPVVYCASKYHAYNLFLFFFKSLATRGSPCEPRVLV